MNDLQSIFDRFKKRPQYEANAEVRALVDAAESEALALEKAGDLRRLNELIGTMKKKLLEILAKKDKANAPLTDSSESNEHQELLINLGSQYPKRVETLEYFEFFEPGTKEVTAINGKRYPMPGWNEIWASITPDHLDTIKKQIPDPRLLVVPLGMAFEKIAQKIGAKNGKLPMHNQPFIKDYMKTDLSEGLTYFPAFFNVNSGGMSKSKLLETDGSENLFPGWQVLVVSGEKSVPAWTLGKSANNLLREFEKLGLSGLTPEEWLLWHGENVREGVPGDTHSGHNLNIAVYMRESKTTPVSLWINIDGKAFFSRELTIAAAGNIGARPAVRIW